MEKLKVLHFIPAFEFGGIETIVTSLYRGMNKDVFEFDILVEGNRKSKLLDDIQKMGGRVYRVEVYKRYNLLSYSRQIKGILLHNNYKIIHAHTVTRVPILFYVARQCGIKNLILHAHITSFSNKVWERHIKEFICKINTKLATYYAACSVDAAKYYYGKNYGDAKIIHNAIETEKYKFRIDGRKKIRQLHSMDEDDIVIGFVGRLMPQKNIDFLCDIFLAVSRKEKNARFLIVGDGQLKSLLYEKMNRFGLDKKLVWCGRVENVRDYYSAMDMLIMPSFQEGLPLTVVEAQASGLPALLSDRITKEVALTDLVGYESLDRTAEEWAEKICEIVHSSWCDREDAWTQIKDTAYDITKASKDVEQYYKGIVYG